MKLARALDGPPILDETNDEATSALDSELERIIQLVLP